MLISSQLFCDAVQYRNAFFHIYRTAIVLSETSKEPVKFCRSVEELLDDQNLLTTPAIITSTSSATTVTTISTITTVVTAREGIWRIKKKCENDTSYRTQ